MTIPNSVTSIGKWAFLFVPNVDYYGNDTAAPWGAQKLNQKPAIFSVSLAKEYCSYGGSLANQYFYVTGVVSDINEVSTQYGNATYYIRDENENNPLLCYRLKYLYGENYTSTNQIKTNDKVTMLCKLQTYHAGSSDEHLEATNGYLISTSAIRSFVDVPFVYRYINSSEVAVHYAGLTDTLTNISIPEKVNLESIDYTITTIDDGAFYKCSSLKSFTIPNSIKKIGNNAFSYCTSLTSITIPENIQNIGEYTFSDCTNLQSVLWNAIDCSASHDGHKVFPIFQGCKNITSFTIDKKVKKLPDGLCYGLPISKITIPNSVISIGVSTFRKCINLTSIDVPDNVTSMGDCAFEACTNLKSLSLGTNITTFGDSAFASCSKISEIYNYRKTPAKLGKHAFVDVDYFNCTLYVLNSSVEMYKSSSSDWKDFYYIKPIGAESVTTETVQVTPTENTANIIWPSVSGAETYELVIKDKSGNIICTLVFNAQGQLISIVFHAPGRDMPQQTQTAGFSFTVTGLEEGQSYVLTITSKDNNGNTLDQKSVSFTTGDEQGIEDINVNTKAHKLLRNGQILILRGDRTYTVTGQEIK